MIKVADLMITSLDTISAFTLAGAFAYKMDELQDATIANTQEKTDITGKQGRKLGSLKKNKAVTVSGTNGLLSAGLMQSQVGSNFEEKTSTSVLYTDYLTVKDNKATTTYKGVGTAGAEIEALYVVDGSGVANKELTQAEATAAGKFAYAPDTKTLTFNANEIEDGTSIVVYYNRNVKGNVLKNESDKYSEKLEFFIDGTAEDRCGSVYHIQFHIPKGDISGNFDLAMGGDQTTHAFEIESLAGSCGAGGALWECVVFGANAEDAA